MKKTAILLLFLSLFTVSCTQKKDSITSHTLSIAVSPSAAQSLSAGSQLSLKATVSGAQEKSSSVNPAWSVENNLGTFSPAEGTATTFTAGTSSGTGKIYATYGTVRGETLITIGANNCTGTSSGTGSSTTSGSSGGSGSSTSGSDGGCSATYYGLFSETYRIPGILLDTDSSRFSDGGAIGVWPEDESTTLCDGTGSGEMSEGTKGLKCIVGCNGGGWWLQFGSDSTAGLDDCDVMKAKDMSAFSGGSLKFDVKTPKDVLIALKWGDSTVPESSDVTLRELGVSCDNQWHAVSIPLSRFSGINLKKIKMPASFNAAPGSIEFTFYIDNVRWEK